VKEAGHAARQILAEMKPPPRGEIPSDCRTGEDLWRLHHRKRGRIDGRLGAQDPPVAMADAVKGMPDADKLTLERYDRAEWPLGCVTMRF